MAKQRITLATMMQLAAAGEHALRNECLILEDPAKSTNAKKVKHQLLAMSRFSSNKLLFFDPHLHSSAELWHTQVYIRQSSVQILS
jgi:hypothetical protein